MTVQLASKSLEIKLAMVVHLVFAGVLKISNWFVAFASALIALHPRHIDIKERWFSHIVRVGCLFSAFN
jgi:hypothetical protein